MILLMAQNVTRMIGVEIGPGTGIAGTESEKMPGVRIVTGSGTIDQMTGAG
jgi:hypothetical protein